MRSELKAVADSLPQIVWRSRRRLDRAVENEAMPLIVVRPSVVLPDVEIVDRGAEEELAHVVQRLRVRVRHAIVPHRAGR